MTLTNLPDRQPDNYRELIRRYRADPDAPITMEKWAEMAETFRVELSLCRPALIFYRTWLRAVWRRQDPDGSYLRHALGFEADGPAFHDEAGKR